MKYRGNYEVTKKLTTKDLEATGSVTVSDVAVGNLTVSTGADMGGQPIKNMGAPVDAGDALTRQYFEDNQVKAIFSNAEPTSSDGVDGALWMKTGGDSFSPPTSLNSNPQTDDFALAVTNTGVVSSVNLATADDKVAYTTDAGVTWSETTFPTDGTQKGFLLGFRNSRMGFLRSTIDPAADHTLYTTDGGATWAKVNWAPIGGATRILDIVAAESDPKQGKGVAFTSNADQQVMYSSSDGNGWSSYGDVTGFNHDTIIDVTVTNLAAMVLYDGNKIRQTSNFASWAGKTALTVSGATAPDTWTAISHQTSAGRVVAVGTGGNSQYVATSTNTGGSWTYRDLGVGPLEAYDVCFNKGSEVTVISGANGMFYSTDYTQLAGTTACTITGGTDYPTKLYADESNGGFYGISDNGTVSKSTDGINWTISETPGITQIYGKSSGSWVPTQFKTEEEIITLISENLGGSDFLPTTGGTVTGEIVTDTLKVVSGADMGGSQIVNIGDPVGLTDAVNRQYFESNKFQTTFGADDPLAADGSAGDIYVKGSAGGEDRRAPNDVAGTSPIYDIASDGTRIAVVGNRADTPFIATSTDTMQTWSLSDATGDPNQNTGLAFINLTQYDSEGDGNPVDYVPAISTWPPQVSGNNQRAGSFTNTTAGGYYWTVVTGYSGEGWTDAAVKQTFNSADGFHVVALVDGQAPVYSNNGGDFFQKVSDPVLAGADFGAISGTTAVLFDSIANKLHRIDTSTGAVTNSASNWTASPAFTETCVTAHTNGRFYFGCNGANSGYVLTYTVAGGQSFYNPYTGDPELNLSEICINSATDVLVMVSTDDQKIHYADANTSRSAAEATIIGDRTNMPTKVIAHGTGFIGINQTTGHTAWSDDGSVWNISSVPSVNGVFYKSGSTWIESPYQTQADVIDLIVGNSPDTSAFLPTTGGTITGSLTIETGLNLTGGNFTLNGVNSSFVGANVVFQDGNVNIKNGNLSIDNAGGIVLDTGVSFNAGANKISNVADPTTSTDVATKGYVDSGNAQTLTNVSSTTQDFAEFAYTATPFVFVDVVAYATGKRYMSTVHLVFDGTDINIQEFGVISVGGLNVDIEGKYTTGSNAALTATVTTGETDITVKIAPRYR